MPVSQELMKEYEEAIYQIRYDGDHWMGLSIGEEVPEEFKGRNFGMVFSYNPYSQVLVEFENQEHQRHLIEVCKAKGYEFLECRGGARELLESREVLDNPRNLANPWEWEYGLAIFEVSPQVIEDLGRAFEQNAVVYCPSDGVPYLLESL